MLMDDSIVKGVDDSYKLRTKIAICIYIYKHSKTLYKPRKSEKSSSIISMAYIRNIYLKQSKEQATNQLLYCDSYTQYDYMEKLIVP